METKSQTNRNKQVLWITLGVAISILTVYTTKQFFFKAPSIRKELIDAVNQVNKTCPIMIDETTRLDGTLALPGNIFQSNYTLVNIERADLNIDTLKMQLEGKLIDNAMTNLDLKLFRDNMITMAFNYNDKKGVFVLKVILTPDKDTSKYRVN